jgi:two-component system response regulator RegA
VEDDDVFASILGRVLDQRGYETRRAAEVTAALELAGEWPPEAAIVDLKLGHGSGLELIPLLVSACPGIRIVVLTGYASIATAVQAVKLGASEYLSKPADIDRIVAALQGLTAPEPDADTPSVRRLEWEHIQRVLQERGGNISAAARALGMHRRTLQRKLAKRPASK